MTSRRTLLIALGGGLFAIAFPAQAQPGRRVPRVGFFGNGTRQGDANTRQKRSG